MSDFTAEFTLEQQETVNAEFTLGESMDMEATFQIDVRSDSHKDLIDRDADNQHPISAITGLQDALDSKQGTLTAGDNIKIENNVISSEYQSASETDEGIVYLATDTDATTGLDDSKAMTPLKTTKVIYANVGRGIELGFNGTLESGVLTFEPPSETGTYELKHNYRYELDLLAPIVGTLDETTKVVIKNGTDTIQINNILADNVTLKELSQIQKYDTTTGYRWIFNATFKITESGSKVFVMDNVVANLTEYRKSADQDTIDAGLSDRITANTNKFNDYRTSANQDTIDTEIKESVTAEETRAKGVESDIFETITNNIGRGIQVGFNGTLENNVITYVPDQDPYELKVPYIYEVDLLLPLVGQVSDDTTVIVRNGTETLRLVNVLHKDTESDITWGDIKQVMTYSESTGFRHRFVAWCEQTTSGQKLFVMHNPVVDMSGKQDVITDLDTIRSNASAGKSASDTIATYGNIVTHNTSEFASSDLVPAQASATNQLADKEFVNSSISTSTATFRGTYDSVEELPTTGVDDNDYAFVITKDTSGNTIYNRYKYTPTGWLFEYSLNNSSFTATQWSAINSGATTEIINSISDKADKSDLEAKQDKLTAGNNITITDNTISATVPTKVSELTNDSNYQTATQVSATIETHNTSTSAHEDIREKIKDIELFKFPNAVIIGTPTIQSGQVSNFTTNNYMQFPFVVDVRNKNFEIDFCFTTGSNVTTQQNILDSKFGLALAIANGKGLMAMSSNGTNWDIGSTSGTYTINANTTYYAKVTWNGTTYATALSTDGETYTTDMTLTSSLGLYPTTIYIGGGSSTGLGRTPNPFFGSINFNKCYLYVAGLLVWQGMDDAGLATRADVSLSNLDSEGTAKITYTAGTNITIENNVISASGQVATNWGSITGTLSDQTDLQNALNEKYDASNPNGYITGITSSDVTTALGYTPYNSTNPSGYITSSALDDYTKTDDLGMMAFADKVTNGDIDGTINQDKITDLATTLSGKQDTLTAGENITIDENNIISATGGDTIANQNPNSITPLKVWQGTETQWEQGEATTWYNWETDAVANWTQAELPSSTDWQSIAYGNGKFVAVVQDSNISAYSTDGINWILSTLPTSSYWYSVTYGNGKFVAIVQSSNKSAYSTDGINWILSTLPTSTDWQSVTYGDGKFVAIAYDSDISAYSEDGINWTQTTLPSSQDWSSVTYGSGKFVAVAEYSDESAYSTDGINWTQTTMPSSQNWQSVTYGDGKFVAVAFNSGISAYSEDGINWIKTTMPSSAWWNLITYGDGKFVSITFNSNISAYSTDGINWTQTIMPSSGFWQSITYGDGKFVAIIQGSDVSAYFTISQLKCLTLDEHPTTSSTVYSAVETPSSLTVSSTTDTSITLSDANVYNYNESGNKFTYRTIGDAHPDYLSFIDETAVKIGTTDVANIGGNIDNKSITKNSSDELQTVAVIDNNSNAIKTWTGTLAEYNALTTKDDNTLYHITDDNDVTMDLLKTIYPVGSLYLTVNDTCPLASLFGTWTKVSEDRVLQGAGSRGTVGSTLNESLPNITGSSASNSIATEWYYTDDMASNFKGALYVVSKSSSGITNTGSGATKYALGFNASRSSSTYQDNAPVQPNAYLINIFQRTE